MILMHLVAALGNIDPGSLPDPRADTKHIKLIFQIVFGIIGALALLMITISGLRYVLAGSDAQRISKAKNGIIYSLVGLVIALTAEAIVAFVVGRL